PRRVHNLMSDWRLVADGGQGFGPTVARWVSVYDATPVPTDSLNGKVLAGYQGWFATPYGPPVAGWRHWCKAGTTPAPDTVTFDLWPDLREWSDDELAPSGFVYPDGSPAGLYTSYDAQTIERHVRWMKEYGLDGVWLQRFAAELGDPVFKDFRDTVTEHMIASTQVHGRAFAIMYDISGMSEDPSIFDQIVSDWTHLVDDLYVTDSPRYMHHGGRPVLGIWGLGFNDRPGEPVGDKALIEHLQSGIDPAYRVTVMGGVPQGWRTSSGSSKPGYSGVYEAYDLLSPWSVGAYSADSYGNFKQNYIAPDLGQQGANAYVPVIWPGFSWKNLQDNQNGGSSTLNHHPRHGGTFLWDQAWGAYSAGATMGYIAMFDEVDEATAIFKAAETAAQTPTTGTFLSLDVDGDALPSDWYLRLAGEVVNLFRGVYPNQPQHPLVTSGGGGVTCGDGACAPGVEDCGNCPGDCLCPNGTSCQGHLCVDDGPGCGDGACAPGVEDCGNCPGDCPCPGGSVCQDHQCVEDGGEIPGCGDGSCAPGVEDCGNCPGDCPCPTGTACQAHQCVDIPDCGDGICTFGVEGCDSCPEDCPCTDSGLCVGDECIEF
ncbi:MAG: glycoside hydrolase family 71/99-like protein, partial [Myxococcota bacterium]|nr:glycoside hydrolase family 71/99-like protein [Myxococcota bacterium]